MSKLEILEADGVDSRLAITKPLAGTFTGVKSEVVLVAVTIGLLVASSYDAFRDIPPIADDLWMIEFRPGQIFLTYGAEHGWVGRVLGQIVIDTVNSAARLMGGDLRVPLIVVRAVSLALVFRCLKRGFAQPLPIGLAAIAFFALTPAAVETWAMLCTTNLTLAAPAALFACASFSQAAVRAANGIVEWKLIAYGLILQTVTNALYEQAVLAVPAFSVVLVFVLSLRRRLSWSNASRIAIASTAAAVAWLSCLFASGYVASRSAAPNSFEASDIVGGFNALWIAFVKHNLWRAVELIRGRDLGWWDSSATGTLAMLCALALAVVVGVVLAKSRSAVVGDATPDRSIVAPPAGAVAVAAIVAAFAAVLPAGLANSGFLIYSRMFYLPGLFIAVALAAAIGVTSRRWPVYSAIAVALFTLWNGMTLRRYLSDMRDGARVVRVVANGVAHVRDAGSRGVLVVAPEVVGTFSTSAVQSSSLRAAVRGFEGVDVVGPLYFAETCDAAREPGAKVFAEGSRPTDVREWDAVVRYVDGTVITGPSLEKVCGK